MYSTCRFICFRVTHCHKVTHFSTDLPQLSTYVIYYLIKVLRCEGSIVRSVNILLTHTVYAHYHNLHVIRLTINISEVDINLVGKCSTDTHQTHSHTNMTLSLCPLQTGEHVHV